MAITLITNATFQIKGGIAYAACQSGEETIELALPISAFRMMLAEGQRAVNDFDVGARIANISASRKLRKGGR